MSQTPHLSHKMADRGNSLGPLVGAGFLIAGAVCLLIKSLLENDSRPEVFFLLPVSALLTCCGVCLFLIMGIRNILLFWKEPSRMVRRKYLAGVLECSSIVFGYAAVVLFLIEANSGRKTLPYFFLCAAVSAFLGISACVLRTRLKKHDSQTPFA